MPNEARLKDNQYAASVLENVRRRLAGGPRTPGRNSPQTTPGSERRSGNAAGALTRALCSQLRRPCKHLRTQTHAPAPLAATVPRPPPSAALAL